MDINQQENFTLHYWEGLACLLTKHPVVRQIIIYRHGYRMKWRDIAQKIGGGNSEYGIRMAYKRFLEKEKTQD